MPEQPSDFDFDLSSPTTESKIICIDCDPSPQTSKAHKSTRADVLNTLCPSSITYKGFQFTRNGVPRVVESKSQSEALRNHYVTAYYKCKHSRSVAKGNCKASLSLQVDVDIDEYTDNITIATHVDNSRYKVKDAHSCGQDYKSVVGSSGVENFIPVMEDAVRTRALEVGLSKPALTIARQVYEEFEGKQNDKMARLASVHHLKDVINSTRQEENSNEMAIYQSPTINCSDTDPRKILLFDMRYTSPNQKDQPLQRAIGWGNPDLINLVKHGPVALFCDATFRAAVKGFLQCLIIMVYLKAVDMFVPIWYTLMTCKDEDSYGRVFEQILRSADGKLQVTTATTDFEKAEMNQIQQVFKPKHFVGCVFHWKQCLRRKLIELHVNELLISYLIGDYDEDAGTGYILLLTIIDPTEIVSKGIPYIRHCLRKEGTCNTIYA